MMTEQIIDIYALKFEVKAQTYKNDLLPKQPRSFSQRICSVILFGALFGYVMFSNIFHHDCIHIVYLSSYSN